MIFDDMADFAAALPPMRAIIGLDLGEKTIGVAVTDNFLSVATPLETVRRKKFGLDAARLAEIIAARQIGGLVLGLPRNMDGSEGRALPIHPRIRTQFRPDHAAAHHLLG